jgi:hypothetical protein
MDKFRVNYREILEKNISDYKQSFLKNKRSNKIFFINIEFSYSQVTHKKLSSFVSLVRKYTETRKRRRGQSIKLITG